MPCARGLRIDVVDDFADDDDDVDAAVDVGVDPLAGGTGARSGRALVVAAVQTVLDDAAADSQ